MLQSSKQIITLCLCALSLALPCWGERRKTTADSSTDIKVDARKNGLFNIIRSADDWYFELPDSLLSRRFLVTVRFTTTPAGTGKYGGEQVNQQTVYWQTSPTNKQLLLRSDLLVNTADSLDAINRAVVASNADPIIGSFKIEKHADGVYLIKMTEFFNEDNPAIGVPQRTRSAFGLQSYLSSSSYIESVKTFPMNTEVRMVKTWYSASNSSYAAAFTGKVSLGLNVSFVLLPEVPMMRRLFDPRVGYFTDSFSYYSDDQQRVENKRFITRWRLEPKDSADMEKMKRGELVEPKKPIVYYIDPATPKQWRPYLIQGVNDWQKAFEQAGFKNAIMAKEWPENDSTMSMEDARFSVIRYLASPIANAYGPQVHDPRSGEIIESHICWYHNVMTLVHDWYMIQAGTLDEAARKMKYDEHLMGELIRFVSSHEVGHTLGLRHNFGSSSTVPVDSLRNKAWVEAHGHTPSIMDYARFNYVAQPEDSISRIGIFPRIGDYDLWAIRWGYTPMWEAYDDESDHWELEKMTTEALAGNRRLWFGDGETNTTNDSRCQTEDLGDDAVKASEYGLLNLKREIKALPEWTYQSNDIYGRNLSEVYRQIQSQFLRYAMHVFKNIAGVYKDYKTVDQPGDVYTNVPRAKQKAALAYLDRHVFNEPRWFIEPAYVKRLSPDPQQLTLRLGNSVLSSMLQPYLMDNFTSEYPLADYLNDLSSLLFKEAASGSRPTPYRRQLQGIFVTKMTEIFSAAATAGEVRPVVLQTLRDLQRRLQTARTTDATVRAHWASLSDVIERSLSVK